MRWQVLYVKPRCEKKLAEYCQILDVDAYLPLRREVKIYQRRKVTVFKPLFPGYVFADISDHKAHENVLKTNTVLRLMVPPNQEKLVHDLEQIRQALSVDDTLGASKALKRGKNIRIRSGPFMGLEGKVSRIQSQTKVRIAVDMIGQALTVEVDKDYLELID